MRVFYVISWFLLTAIFLWYMMFSSGNSSVTSTHSNANSEIEVVDEVKGSSYTNNVEDSEEGKNASIGDHTSDSGDSMSEEKKQENFRKEGKERPDYSEKANITFLENKTSIVQTPEFSAYLDSIANVLNQDEKFIVHLIGHTSTTSGINVDNHAIGIRRAEHIKSLLTERGVDFSKITIESKGSDQPAEEGESVEARKKNRRVELFLKTN